MPLSDTDIVQSNSGSFVAASGSATLPVGTTAGNTVLLVASCHATQVSSLPTPSGFVATETPTQSNNNRLYLFRRSDVPADETSWTLSPGTATDLLNWVAFEVAGLDLSVPLDVGLSANTSTISGTSASSGTTPTSTTYDGLKLAIWTAWDAASVTAPTFDGHSGGLTETVEVGGTDGTRAMGLSVATAFTQAVGAFTSTATSSITLTSTNSAASFILVYTAAGAKRAADIKHFWGFKIGTGAAGLATGNAGFRYIETMVGSPAITADGLQCSATAAAESVASALIQTTLQTIKSAVARVKLRLDTSLPGADLELARITPSVGDGVVVLRYVSASQKLGVKIGTGTEQLSAAAVAADTWYAVELRLIGTTTAYTLDWQVDDGAGLVAQAQATFTASNQLTHWTPLLGWVAASTGTVTYASALYSIVAGHHPLGDHTVVLLGPDPAATPTVSGTSSSFRRFTSNGTIDGSFNAADIRNAVDDWPPTIGASADGLAVITAHASDYIEIPLATHQAAPDGSIRAARPVLCMWAASATAATCKMAAYDGSAATTLFAEADPAADNSTTAPAWICAMWKPTGGWTQAKLDAAAIRFGSNDATPDIGPHAVGMEVAVQVASQDPLFGELSAPLRIEQDTDPVTGGILGLRAYTPAEQSATLRYELGGVEQTPVSVAAGSNPHTVVIDAADATVVTRIEFEPSG